MKRFRCSVLNFNQGLWNVIAMKSFTSAISPSFRPLPSVGSYWTPATCSLPKPARTISSGVSISGLLTGKPSDDSSGGESTVWATSSCRSTASLTTPPPPSRSTLVSPSGNGINEISTTSVLDQLLPPFLQASAPACTPVSTITPGLDPSDTPPLPIAQDGQSLSNSIATVADAFFTTRIKVHSGPSTSSRYGLVALLDTGLTQTLISA